MKLAVCIAVVAVALLGSLAAIEAYPQQPTYQHLVYYPPPPPPPPQPIRVRRQVLGGQLSSNPAGGADAKLHLSKGVGTADHNVIGSVFAAGSTRGGPVATGGSLAYNNNGHGVSLTKEHIPGVRDTFTQSGHVNLFKNDAHSISANAFASQNKLANGFKFERNGGGLDWAHKDGHGANVGISNIPNFGKQLDFGGRANLWQSQDRNTRLDLNAGGSKWLSGPLSNQRTNFGGGLGLTHTFG